MAATAHLTLVAPDNKKFTVQLAPARLLKRKPNAEYRSREHLTEREVGRLIEAMKGNRWGHRGLPRRSRLLVELAEFSKNLDECRWVPFCVEVPAA